MSALEWARAEAERANRPKDELLAMLEPPSRRALRAALVARG